MVFETVSIPGSLSVQALKRTRSIASPQMFCIFFGYLDKKTVEPKKHGDSL